MGLRKTRQEGLTDEDDLGAGGTSGGEGEEDWGTDEH